MKSKRLFKINNKIWVSYTLLIAIIVTGIFLYFNADIQSRQTNQISTQLMSILKFSTPLIDGDFHSLISDDLAENDLFFKNIARFLLMIKENDQNIIDIYTIREKNYELVYGVNVSERVAWNDLFPHKDIISFDNYNEISDTDADDNDIYFDLDDRLLGVSPIYDQFGNIQTLLVIEYNLDQLLKNQRNLQLTFAALSIILIPLVFIFSFWFAKMLTNPINELMEGANRIKNGEFTQKVEIHSNDEFQMLGHSFNNMMSQLRHTLENLQKEIINISNAHYVQRATYQISQAAITSTNADDLYSIIHKIIGEVIFAENFYITLLSEDKKHSEVVYFRDDFQSIPDNLKEREKFINDFVLKDGKKILLSKNDIQEIIKIQNLTFIKNIPNEWLGIPLKIDENCIGVMVTQRYDEHLFTNDDIVFFEYVSNQIALSIERKRAEEEIFNSNERYYKLFNESPTPYIEIDYSELLNYIEANNFEKKQLIELTNKNPKLLETFFNLLDIIQINKKLLDLFKADNIEILANRILNSSNLEKLIQIIFIILMEEDKNKTYDLEFTNNEDEEMVLSIKWSNISFYKKDKRLYRTIISLTDITQQKLHEEKLTFENTHDSLSGLYNRTYFNNECERLESEMYSPFSLIMIDIDDLKIINDEKGHIEGDNVIKEIAKILTISFRKDDIIVRFGGDEFLILLPNTHETSLIFAIDRIKQNLNHYNTNNKNNEIFLSIGYSTQYGKLSIQELIKNADESMYRNKKGKKLNRN